MQTFYCLLAYHCLGFMWFIATVRLEAFLATRQQTDELTIDD